MSKRHLITNRPGTKAKIRGQLELINSKLSIARYKIGNPVKNLDITDSFRFLKSPTDLHIKQYSSIFHRKKSFQIPSSSISHICKRLQALKKNGKKHKQRSLPKTSKLSLSSMSSRKNENLRYLNQTLEESESYKNLNGVSTPPDEEPVIERRKSPFSEIIDQDISNYINQGASKFSKLEIPKSSLVYTEDSYQYSTAESHKRVSYKYSFEKSSKTPEPPKTPPPCSIYSELQGTLFTRVRSKKHKGE